MDELVAYLNTQGHAGKRDIARQFGLRGSDARQSVNAMLKDLKHRGVIQSGRGGRSVSMTDALPDRCIVEITGIDSMGDLVARPNKWTADTPAPQIIITRDKLSVGIGDIVQVKIKRGDNNLYEGETLRKMTAGENHLVAVYENGFVQSVDRRLKQAFKLESVPAGITLQNRDIVIVDAPPIRTYHPAAQFVRKIGSAGDAFSATLISIYAHNIPVAFDAKSEEAANAARVPPVGKTHADLTAVPFVTIDGADARDFDDAVWAEPDADPQNAGGWHLMVGIADVAWYVRPGSHLDADARLRGNSVYFPDRALPMLPPALSNGVCSLNPHEPRASMVCEIWLDKAGHKRRHQFARGIIQSARRLTYDEVQAMMDGQADIPEVKNELKNLIGCYHALKQRRQRRGVLEIDVPERQVILDDKGRVVDIRLHAQTDAMKLIEEMMICANVAAAETLEDKGAPCMYRVHDRPSVQKVETLNNFLRSLGQSGNLSVHSDPAAFNDVLVRAQGSPRDHAVNEFVLRSQSQAQYSPDNIGHFGLALQHYAHFTSPIRRYADVLVHRSLIRALKLGEGGLSDAEAGSFDTVAEHISSTERQEASAEQDAVDRYVAAYLNDKVGAPFTARISSATSFGLFVHLDAYGADGFVPMSSLTDDFYIYDDKAQRLAGRTTGRTFTVGDMCEVVLRECVPITGGLVFQMLGLGKRRDPNIQKHFARPKGHPGRRKKK